MSYCYDTVVCWEYNSQVKPFPEKAKQEKNPCPHLSYYSGKCDQYLLLCSHCWDTAPRWRYVLQTL